MEFDCFQSAFADKEGISTRFQRLHRDPGINQQVAKEHLADLDSRLRIVMNRGDERGRYFDFEQFHWKTQVYYVQLLHLRGILSKKQGDRSQTEQLLIELRVSEEERFSRENESSKMFSENSMMKN